MLLSNPARFFPILAIFICLLTGCRYSGTQANAVNSAAENSDVRIPFSTREPDVFSADIVITTGDSSETIFTARSGLRRRYDVDPGSDRHLEYLQTESSFVIFPQQKAYAETAAVPSVAGSVPLDDPVTTSLLNTKTYTEFTKVGETDRGLVRYRAKPFGSDNSAVYLDIDPAVGFPVRQEFYSLAGGTEALQYTMEVRNFSTEAADDLFAIPAGYKKVSPAEMDRLIRRR